MNTGKLIHSFRVSLFATALVVALAVGIAEAAPSFNLSVRDDILVSRARIDASSLVRESLEPDLQETLGRITLGNIPNPLGELSLNRSDLQRMLGDLARKFQLPEVVTFKRTGDILSGDQIRQRVIKICTDKAGEKLQGKLSVNLERVPSHIVVPGELKSWQVESLSTNRLGMLLFNIIVESSGGTIRQVFQVDVSMVVKAAKTARMMRPGEMIQASDLVAEEVAIKSENAQIPVDFDEAVGQRMARFKSAGTIIRQDDLGSVPISHSRGASQPADRLAASAAEGLAISPGQEVDYVFQRAGLTLSVPARAVQGGRVGDQIRLMNLQNNRTITGVIVAEGRVEYAEH